MDHMDKYFLFRHIVWAISKLLSVLITNLGLMEFIQEMFYLYWKSLCDKFGWQKKYRSIGFHYLLTEKQLYIYIFFCNWIYSSRRIKQSQRQIHNLETIWWFHYVWILLFSFHRTYDCRKNFVRLYQFIFSEWLLK